VTNDDLPENELSDDSLCEAIADAITQQACRPGAGRLHALQMAGLASDPPTQEDLAAAFGLSVYEVRCIEGRALLRIAYLFPELRDELRSNPSEVLRGREAEKFSSE
jgi:hypothetical protein